MLNHREDIIGSDLTTIAKTCFRAQKIKNLTFLANYLTTDLKEGCVPSHKLFFECMQVNYSKHAFEMYETQVRTVDEIKSI
jgi:hypothetical protein